MVTFCRNRPDFAITIFSIQREEYMLASTSQAAATSRLRRLPQRHGFSTTLAAGVRSDTDPKGAAQPASAPAPPVQQSPRPPSPAHSESEDAADDRGACSLPKEEITRGEDDDGIEVVEMAAAAPDPPVITPALQWLQTVTAESQQRMGKAIRLHERFTSDTKIIEEVLWEYEPVAQPSPKKGSSPASTKKERAIVL